MNEITLDDLLKYASPSTLVSIIKDCEPERHDDTANEIRRICWHALECNVGVMDALDLVVDKAGL